jgi:hypothetical protein
MTFPSPLQRSNLRLPLAQKNYSQMRFLCCSVTSVAKALEATSKVSADVKREAAAFEKNGILQLLLVLLSLLPLLHKQLFCLIVSLVTPPAACVAWTSCWSWRRRALRSRRMVEDEKFAVAAKMSSASTHFAVVMLKL